MFYNMSYPCQRAIRVRLMGKDNVYFGPTGLIMQMKSPIAPGINHAINSMVQGGIVNQLFKKDLTAT